MAEAARTDDDPRAQAAAAALATLQARVGQEVHLSDWLTVTQAHIDAFATATGDHQWIHVDPARAARESPWGSTIAHGYLTLALQIPLRGLVEGGRPFLPGIESVLNYGLNRVRFPSAVRTGTRIRGRFTLLEVAAVSPTALQITERYVAEIEGEPKPACSADSIMRLVF